MDQLPSAPPTLVYSCSGCSSAAQLANHLAVRLDRNGDAEMSCIAGLGGHVKSLIRTAQNAVASGRPILDIDGCPLACVKKSLAQHSTASRPATTSSWARTAYARSSTPTSTAKWPATCSTN